jgi:hypothetical protein
LVAGAINAGTCKLAVVAVAVVVVDGRDFAVVVAVAGDDFSSNFHGLPVIPR